MATAEPSVLRLIEDRLGVYLRDNVKTFLLVNIMTSISESLVLARSMNSIDQFLRFDFASEHPQFLQQRAIRETE